MRTIADCDQRLAKYRAALEAGTEPELVACWTADVNSERAEAEAKLHRAQADQRPHPSEDDIAALIGHLGDLYSVLTEAGADDKAEVYRRLGLRIIYEPSSHTARAEIRPDPQSTGVKPVSGGLEPFPNIPVLLGTLEL